MAGLMVFTPSQGLPDRFILDAFELLKTAMPGLRQAGKSGGSIFVAVSRMDGAFRLILPKNSASGGLAGLAKTAAKEWPEVRCEALDIPADWADVDAAAEAIVEELMLEGPIEIGLSAQGSVTLQLSETSFADLG